MKFNYQTERIKFDSKWDKLQKEYRAAGMSDDAIEEMWQYDWDEFKKERVFSVHNQYLSNIDLQNNGVNEDEGKNPLLNKFLDTLAITDKYFADANQWIEKIENPSIVKQLKTLNDLQILILTNYVFEEKTQKEIAEELNVSQQAVAKQIEAIRKKLKKFL